MKNNNILKTALCVSSLFLLASCSPPQATRVELSDLLKNTKEYEGRRISTECFEYVASYGPMKKDKATPKTKLDIRLLDYNGYSYSHIYAETPLYSPKKGEEILRSTQGLPAIKVEGNVKNSKILMKKLWVNEKEYHF